MDKVVENPIAINNTIDTKLYKSYLGIIENYSEEIFTKQSEDYSKLSGLFVTASPTQWEEGKKFWLLAGRPEAGMS